MSRWNKPKDTNTKQTAFERRMQSKERVPLYDSSFVPLAPAVPTITFKVKEKKTQLEFYGIAAWPAGSPNVCQADVDYYVVQLQYTNNVGVPQANGKIQTLNIKGTASPLEATFAGLDNPQKWYVQCRVRLTDKGHRESAYSAWSTPILPFTAEADPVPPTPTGLTINFDKQTRQRDHSRFSASIQWDEVGNWDIPGYNKADDVASYQVEVSYTDIGGTILTATGGQPLTRVYKVHDIDGKSGSSTGHLMVWNIAFDNYIKARIRSVDRFQRKGAWSAYTPVGTPADVTPPPAPINVTAYSSIAAVGCYWEAPVGTDPEIWDKDIAYFQVQAATRKSFSPGSTIVRKDRYVNIEEKEFGTKSYRTRYFFRVRSVDASGNVSAWTVPAVNPGVKPLKAAGGKKKGSSPDLEPDVDYTNKAGLDLGGSMYNRAYSVSGASMNTVYIDGEEGDGKLYGEVQLADTPNRCDAGFLFRGIDASNYLYAELRKTNDTTQNLIQLVKRDVGVSTVLGAAVSSAGLEAGSTYVVRVEAPSTDIIKIYVDNILKVTHTLVGADLTKYGAVGAKNVGLWIDRTGATLDIGDSRFSQLTWVQDSDGAVVIDDIYNRDISALLIGDTQAAQAYTVGTGVWGIADDAHETGIFGAGVIMPIYYAENQTELSSVNLPNVGQPKRIGEGGAGSAQSSPAMEIVIDRPARLVIDAAANVLNESNTDVNMQFYIIIDVGTNSNGVAVRQFCQGNDLQGQTIRRRLLVNIRHHFYDPTAQADGTRSIFLYWGYKISGNASRNFTISNQKMKCQVTYAPDFPLTGVAAEGGTTDPAARVRRQKWNKRKKNRDRYKKTEDPND